MSIKGFLFKGAVGVALIALLCFAVYKPASAQVFTSKPTTETIPRTARDSRPVPGLFCSQERTSGSFDEYTFVAVDRSLVTTENIRRCLRTLPKHFERTDEQVLSLPVEDVRSGETQGVSCIMVKPIGKQAQWKTTFTIPQLLKQEEIDSCFEKATNGPNRMRMEPTKDA